MIKALVTGGSGEIGRAISTALAKEGMHVIVHGCENIKLAEKTSKEIIDQGGSSETICFNVTDQKSTESSLEKLLSSGPIQVLVNNAGIHDDAPMAGMESQQWKEVIDVTLKGFYNVTKPLLLPMISSRWGRIISISSIAGMIGNRGQVNYSAAKAGLHGASKSLSHEISSRGITVNVVAPGIIDTLMANKHFPEEKIKQLVPMKRAGTTKEIADVVAFLASKKSSYISGQIIAVDGGVS
ncbi:MAG: 3-oxoacyl-ACP reductase FabG [Nitrospinales bacterium]